EQGLKLGIYCSPWDRHEPCYADPAAYDRFYMMQWMELLGNYGEVAEVWFDGAGSQDHPFDWERIHRVIYHHQPDAVCFNGPDVRWVGNEDGLAPNPCWNVVDDAGTPVYRPAECDVPLRGGWFWHPDNEATRKSPAHLWDIYHRSVGHGTNLLLNVGPDPRGLLPEADVAALVNLRRGLDRAYADDLALGRDVTTSSVAGGEPRFGGQNAVDGDPRTRWHAAEESAWLEVRLPDRREVDRAVLQEWLADGERVRRWRLVADGERELAAGESLGHKQIVRFAPAEVASVRLMIEQADQPAAVRALQLFRGADPS
ncbi:MAG: alpha-L-fucosidase, partial [Armatimonadetes bacterium]|nr:alpha-L-fucosidase [Armatimonadota bacterium]